MTNGFAIGFSYDNGWEIVYGERQPVVNWVINKQANHVSGDYYNSEREMLEQIAYYKVAEEYNSPVIHKL